MQTIRSLVSVQTMCFGLFVFFSQATNANLDRMKQSFQNLQEHSRNSSDFGPNRLRSLSSYLGTQILEELQEYGCWCYFNELHGRGKSHPIDFIDTICRELAEGYDCAILDSKSEGQICIDGVRTDS